MNLYIYLFIFVSTVQFSFGQTATEVILEREYRLLGAFQTIKVNVNNLTVKLKNSERKTVFVTENNIIISNKIVLKTIKSFSPIKGERYLVKIRLRGLFGLRTKIKVQSIKPLIRNE